MPAARPGASSPIGEARRQAERVAPRRLAGREPLPGVERLGELERAGDKGALRRRGPARGPRRSRLAADAADDDGNHEVFTGRGLAYELAPPALLRRHRIDDALWREATDRLPFIPQTPKLRSLVLLFLAEKQFSGAHGLEVTDAMRLGSPRRPACRSSSSASTGTQASAASWSTPAISACAAPRPTRTAWCTNGTTSSRAKRCPADRWCCHGTPPPTIPGSTW